MNHRFRKVFLVSILPLLSFSVQIYGQERPPQGPVGVLAGNPPPPYNQLSYEQRSAIKTDGNNGALRPSSPQTYDKARARFNKGMRFIKAKPPQYAEAEKAFNEAIALDPAVKPQANSGLGYVYSATGRYAEAEQLYKSLLAENLYPAENHFNLGAVYFYRGDTASALQEVAVLQTLNRKLAKRLTKLIEAHK